MPSEDTLWWSDIPGTVWIHACGQNKPEKGVTQQHQNAERPVDTQLKSLVPTHLDLANDRKLAYPFVCQSRGD
jgi:hypothetical protein